MKKVTCSDLGGPVSCEVEITGNTPEDMGKKCQEHVMEEIQKGNDAHQEAVENMQSMSPEEQKEKFAEYMKICEDSFKKD